MEEREQPRGQHWDDGHEIVIGSEWCLWRHERLGAVEALLVGMDGGPPEDAFPRAGLEYLVKDLGSSFTSGRVTRGHCTDAECFLVPDPQEFDAGRI